MKHNTELRPNAVAPWFFSGEYPELQRGSNPLTWQAIDGATLSNDDQQKPAGVTALRQEHTVLGLLTMYTYVQQSLDKQYCMVWNARMQPREDHCHIRAEVFQVDALQPLGDLQTVWSQFQGAYPGYFFHAPAAASFEFDVRAGQSEQQLAFADLIQTQFPQFLMPVKVPGLYAPAQKAASNTALLEFFTRQGRVRLIPQDWFNLGQWDFGYQWIAGGARRADNGRITIQGMRLPYYVLDETDRKLPPEQAS
ncbi:MAG: hypothetical protein KDK39_02905 [Leptospiraceae bacterium]|nr:hypothetical protein [Leptospiraceae bacterium]